MTLMVHDDDNYIPVQGQTEVDCQSEGRRYKSLTGQKFGSRFLLHMRPIANLAIMMPVIW